jgi:chromate transporter
MAATGPDRKLGYGELFSGFFLAGITGFGGVLPVARRLIVDQRRWMTQTAFNDLFSLCQFMPGANVVNFAFAFGARQHGVAGAITAVGGLIAAPVGIVMLLGAGYARYSSLPPVHHAITGLAAAAAGLVLATALRIATPIFQKASNIAVAGLVLALVLLAHVSLPASMAITLPIALVLAWRTL